MAELPISDFLRTRLREYDPNFEVRKGTAFNDFLFNPLQYILQPFRDEADELFIAQSLRRILQQDDPDAFDEEKVDDIVANVYVYRYEGGQSSGVARVYYDEPVNREYPTNGVTITGNNSKNYTNPAVFIITEAQMSSQIENGLYYFDIPIISEDLGEDTELDEESLVAVVGDDDVISVTNKEKISGGRDRETNTELIERAKESITVRDLVTGKGINAILFENFPAFLTEVNPIGFGDREMMRDILYNTHVGGKVDIFVKTSNILTTSRDFLGVLVDTTRASKTAAQFELPPSDPAFMGETNIDRTVADPIVTQVKEYSPARFISTVNLSSPVDLSSNQYIRITIDTETKTIRIAGAQESQTSRQEILDSINNAFGVDVAFAYSNTILIQTPTAGKDSLVIVEDPPPSFNSALIPVFGDPAPDSAWTRYGDGPVIFVEDLDYEITDITGEITRLARAVVIADTAPESRGTITGSPASPSDLLVDVTSLGAYASVDVDMVLRILSGPYAGDYRIVEKIDDNNIRLDATFDAVVVLNSIFEVRAGGIKENELIFLDYYFNPVSIDIGKYVQLDEYGRERGIRPGRDDYTISDVAFLRIVSIDAIDAVSGDVLDIDISGEGGYGYGGYGEGQYGVGSSADYRMVVNEPHHRFSAFEDSYIVFRSAYQGYSFRVTYEYVPEIETMHDFCRSDAERVLDGDNLVKHFIPAYVSTIDPIRYSVDETDSSVPTNEELTERVKDYITSVKAGTPLQISDVTQYLLRQVDPNFRYGAFVEPFSLEARIHNLNGVVSITSSATALTVTEEDPFPLDTDMPLTARTSHWIADNIVLERISS